MVVTRSYMCVEPIALHLNTKALRRGIIQLTDPDSDPFGLLIHDSGMVPVCTQIAIVNPETCMLSRIGEFGEIWVASEANAKGFYKSKDPFDNSRMAVRTADGDQRIEYVRTGDLGFLHNVSRPVGPGGALVDMQTLFVLGSIGETFEVNGLNHFPMDIEKTIERTHRKIARAGRYVSFEFTDLVRCFKQADKTWW
jgi:acyl-CoA synthetase (AMP-forming)/AMP-acid ligase II